MKSFFRFFCLICTFFCAGLAYAQKALVKELKLNNGIPVYFRKNDTSQIDALAIVVKGGIAYYSQQDSGIESVLFDLLCEGSEKYPRNTINHISFSTESSVSASTSSDGSVMRTVAIKDYFLQMIEIAADLFKNPSMEQKAYDKIMTNCVQEIQSYMNDPQSLVLYYGDKMIYDGHPYATSSSVTDESVNNITLEKVRAFHKTIMDSRRISLVVYTNHAENEILELLNKEFADIPCGAEELKVLDFPAITVPAVNGVFLHPDAAKTGYAARFFASAPVTDPDYAVSRVASIIYDGIMFSVVRENYGACYSPQTYMESSFAPYACEYIFKISDLENFVKYVEEARLIMASGKVICGRDQDGNYIFEDLADRLEGYKNTYINKKYATQSTTYGIVARMAASLLQFGDVQKADELSVIAKRCTVQDVLRVFKKYWIDESSAWVVITGPEEESKVRF